MFMHEHTIIDYSEAMIPNNFKYLSLFGTNIFQLTIQSLTLNVCLVESIVNFSQSLDCWLLSASMLSLTLLSSCYLSKILQTPFESSTTNWIDNTFICMAKFSCAGKDILERSPIDANLCLIRGTCSTCSTPSLQKAFIDYELLMKAFHVAFHGNFRTHCFDVFACHLSFQSDWLLNDNGGCIWSSFLWNKKKKLSSNMSKTFQITFLFTLTDFAKKA